VQPADLAPRFPWGLFLAKINQGKNDHASTDPACHTALIMPASQSGYKRQPTAELAVWSAGKTIM